MGNQQGMESICPERMVQTPLVHIYTHTRKWGLGYNLVLKPCSLNLYYGSTQSITSVSINIHTPLWFMTPLLLTIVFV